MGSSGHGPKLNLVYMFAATPMTVSEGTSDFCGDIGCVFVFFHSLPLWPNFGLLSASLGYLPLQACLKGLPNFGFQLESVFQQRKML